jgi:antitoxin (DNA-binding transcriptional repressor) of toxin-antitoxin stability system
MNKASIRQLRTEFPKVRALIAREGEVVVTERGQAAYVIKPYVAPRKKGKKPEPFDYYARLIKRMPKPISTAASRAMDADRDDR